MGLNSRTKSMAACVYAVAKFPKSLQMDLTSQLPVTSGHCTVWQKPGHNAGQEHSYSYAACIHVKRISGCCASCRRKNLSCGATHSTVFFHEYGRRVGMVPKSSLKGGKNSLMVEKRTEKPNTRPNKQNTTTRAHKPRLHHHVVFPLCKVKHVRRE